MQLWVYSTYHLELLKIQNLSFHPAIMISVLPSIPVTCVPSKFWKVLIYPALLDLDAHLRSSRILVPMSHLSSRILYFISLGHTLDEVLTWFQRVLKTAHGILSHYFMGIRRWRSGNSERMYFLGLQNHCSGDCRCEIKRHLLLGRKARKNLDILFKSRDVTLPTRAVVVQLLSLVWLCNPMDCSKPDFPVLHHLPGFAQTQVH